MSAGLSIRFPHLGIDLYNIGNGITIFGFQITYYGMIIALGMLVGYLIAEYQAKRTGQDKDLILDFALYAIVLSVVGARIYYVAFAWDTYKDDIWSVFNLRGGGLAIYGGVIAAVTTAFIYAKLKKISFRRLADTCIAGLVAGQAIGRWGNFFNREAFGGYTDSLLAMQLRKADVLSSNMTPDILNHVVNVRGVEFIQVHPTFLYESLWNLVLLILILAYTKKKKFDGELVLIYFLGYGIGRSLIEGLRTDQLLIWGTDLAVSQLLSILLAVTAGIALIWKHRQIRLKEKRKNVL